MPYVLLIFGEMLLISGIQGTQDDFFALLKGDFTGANSFIYWLAAIAVVGGIGYIPKMKPLSNAFLILILVVLVLHQDPQALFAKFNSALQTSATAATPVTPTPTATTATQTQAPANTNTSPGTPVNGATDFINGALQIAGRIIANG